MMESDWLENPPHKAMLIRGRLDAWVFGRWFNPDWPKGRNRR